MYWGNVLQERTLISECLVLEKLGQGFGTLDIVSLISLSNHNSGYEKIRVGVHSSSSITSYAAGFPAAGVTEQGASKTSFVDENHYLILLIEVFGDCGDSF